MKIVAAIPARLNAQRFPGKILAPIAGRPMLSHVIERVKQVAGLTDIIVATDDIAIAKLAKTHDVEPIMIAHATSGADRIAQAVAQRPDIDVVVNIQGDEPLMEPSVVDAVILPFKNWEQVEVVTASRLFAVNEDPSNPNFVKVVCNHAGRALYFSRAPIPFAASSYQLHIGIYAYWRQTLLQFNAWQPSNIEQSEQLEQLRFLDHDVPVHVKQVQWHGIAVDRPDDIARVEERLKNGIL